MRSRIVLSALIVFVASISLLRGQPIETPLPGLVWVPSSWAYDSTLASIIKPNRTDFVLGWNWVAPYSPLGRMMHTTMFHVGDGFSDEGFYTIIARSRYPMRGMMVVQR